MAETATQQRYQLLESIMDLVDGKIKPDELKKVLEDSRNSLQDIQRSFEENLNGLEPRVKEGVKDQVELIYKFYQDWENAFDAIEQYFKSGQTFDLIRAGEMVKRSSEGMNLAIENYTNQALMVMGPTDIPKLNLLINAVDEVVKEGATIDKLKKITLDEYILAEGAKNELEFERKHYQYTEQELLIKAYEELQGAISNIGHFIKDGNKDLLAKGLEECKIFYPKVKELIPIVNYKRMTFAPTKSPQANLLLNMIYGLKKGSVLRDMFISTIKDVEEDINEVAIKFEAAISQGADDLVMKEELGKAKEGIELFQRAISDCYTFLDNSEGLYLDQAEWELKDASDLLFKAQEYFEELAEREGKTPCVRCGQYNQPDRKTCSKCGAILPKVAGSSAQSTFGLGESGFSEEDQNLVPENLATMFQAVNAVSEGEISVEEFGETIDWMAQIMENNRGGFTPIPKVDLDSLKPEEKETAEKMLADCKEAKALFEEAYRDWEEGLDFFEEFIEVGDKSLLSKGVKVMWDGNKKLDKVKELTKAAVAYQQEGSGKTQPVMNEEVEDEIPEDDDQA